MFTPEEQPLLIGTDDDVSEFIDSERCMVVDWRGTVEESIEDAARFLPPGSLTSRTAYAGDESITVELRFRDRKDTMTFPPQEQNNFRALLRVGHILNPEYMIKIFRCTKDSDTQGFLLRPAAWWTEFRSQYPERHDQIFSELSALKEMWGLDG
jgi:hypothetical protein